nr:glycosyltransferase family A protein [Aequorivita echinoideorum]
MVSVIIPVYNVENFVGTCIDSVIAQVYKNIEILIINDGSTDNSKKIIEGYGDSRIIIINKNNRGVSETRNCGLNAAKGSYICFVDSDDWIETTLISSCVNRMMMVDCDIVYFNYFTDTYSENHEFIDRKSSGLRSLQSNDLEILAVSGYCWNKMYSKNYLIKNNLFFKEHLDIHEDTDFNLRCFSKTNNVEFLEASLYHYNNRVVPSLIKKYDDNRINNFNEVQNVLSESMELKNYSEDVRFQILSNYLMMSIRYQFNALFQYTNSTFNERTIYIRSIIKNINNIHYLKYYIPSGIKDLLIKILILYKLPFVLNVIFTLKK